MLLPFRLILIAAVCAWLAACASRTTASIPQAEVPAPTPEEKPEPLPAGIKPLTMEQEEMISQ